MALTYYEVSHFERPDSSYPEYDRYFGAEENEDFEPCDDDELEEIVNSYCRMGPPDDEYMDQVRERWL